VCGAETWTIQKVDQTWRALKCGAGEGWRISVGPVVLNTKTHILHRIKEKRNILHTIKRRECSWIGHTLHSNCLQQFHITGNIDRRIEVMERRRTCKQLLDGFKETREYW